MAEIDPKPILQAYETWGEDCVKHLNGDFAFAIRDEQRQRIFCARDHFGVKPFFYTHIDGEFKFSSTLNDLRRDPKVSDALNEIAVGDYLLFGLNQDLSSTIFRDIQRLPPAHTLTITNGNLKLQRYWTPSTADEIRFRNPQDYIDRFLELLSVAVADHLHADRVSVSMSGGLDSTTLAALACDQLGDPAKVHACAVVYDTLIPDQERHYSTLAAKHLGIPITHVNADRYSLFDEQVPGEMVQPEPFLISPLTGQFNDLLRACADFGNVMLTGYDGDAFMNEPRPPRFRSKLKRLLGKPSQDDELPPWLDESFAVRTNLRERWKEACANHVSPAERRPSAIKSINSKMWAPLFEGYDPGSTKLDLEVRHPFVDVRLVEFLLALPADPWCVNKHILRQAMKDKLPAAVLNRPKTPLAVDPALQLARRTSVRCLDSFEVSPQLRAFVNLNRRRSIADEKTSDALWASLRVFALNYWLTHSLPAVRRTSQVTKNRTGREGWLASALPTAGASPSS